MALPVNTAVVLQYLGYTLQRDFLVAADGATTAIIEWNHIDTQPTDQTIIDAAASQAFADWQAEHGGNLTLTARHGAKVIPADPYIEGVHARALVELLNKRDNYLTNRIAELQSALDAAKASTGAVQNLRDALPASWLPTNTRSRPEAFADYDALIDSGTAD